ncbi:MAG: LLM class flavin-dependent oxidoreductase [Thaumarchaeota archaeon]|nr:LLM class flavin-dependent oxidoreductase [Nitrososphaerota archaeon]
MLDNLLLDSMNLSSSEILHVAKESIKFGFKKLWTTEGSERDSFAILSSIAPYCVGIGVEIGTNLTSVYSRTPLLIAMSSITLSEITNNHFFLTIGTGGIGYVEKCHGLEFDRPLRRVREYLTLVRKMLTSKVGEKIVFNGEFFKVDFKQRNVPSGPISIYSSALNPKMIQLAGELADGVVLSHLPLGSLEGVKHNLKVGAQKSGRDVSKVAIFSNLPAGLEVQEGIDSLRKMIAFHIAAPTYEYLLELAGHGTECREIREKWESKKLGEAVDMVSDDIINTVSLGYREKDIKQRIRDYEDAGVIPILYPAVRPTSPAQDVIELARICRTSE